ncbi:MAG TPA: hypothetical protein VFJ58_23415 [Armatimonadota bacterium]|nr:hypothetical protein [Armatimonadota bacterium]
MRMIRNARSVIFSFALVYLFIRDVASGDIPATPICIGIPLFLVGCLLFARWVYRRTNDV